MRAIMKTNGVMKIFIYGFVSLTLTLISCGGGSNNGGNPPLFINAAGKAEEVGVIERTPTLRVINITPVDPLGISSGTRLQFAAAGSYSDNSMRDLTTLVAWTSSDTSVATVSNAPGSIGVVAAVSEGYCSISAMLGNTSGSVIIGVK